MAVATEEEKHLKALIRTDIGLFFIKLEPPFNIKAVSFSEAKFTGFHHKGTGGLCVPVSNVRLTALKTSGLSTGQRISESYAAF